MDYNETNATLDQVASEGNFADIVFSEFFLEGVATPILGIFGFFGNVLSIKVSNVIIITRNIVEIFADFVIYLIFKLYIVVCKVLSSRELDMMPSIKHLLKMLAAFDAVFLVFTLTLFCISAWSTSYNDFVRPWLTPYFLPGNHVIEAICSEYT